MNLNIVGQTFEISAPYAEGHTCSAAEARTLNQTRLENISNNLRKRLTELRDEGKPEGAEAGEWTDEKLAKAREMVQETDTSYAFGMGRTGTSAAPRDPVSSEARKIASDALDAKLREKGSSLAKQRKADKEGIEAKIAEWAQNPKVVALAQKRVKERQKTTESLFSDLGEPSVQDEPVAAE